MSSDNIIPLPPVIAPQFDPLASFSHPVGARIIYYITEKLKIPLPEEFQESCKNLDKMREQLRSVTELSIDMVGIVVDYIHMLKGLTKGISIVENGAGLLFKWGTVSMYDTDYEIVCLLYNLTIGILRGLTKLSLNNHLRTIVPLVKTCKSFSEKIMELYNDSFGSTLGRSNCEKLSTFIDLVFYQSQFSVVLETKKAFAPKAGILFIDVINQTRMASQDYCKYYNIVSHYCQAEKFWNESAYGHAVSTIRKTLAFFPDDKTISKMQEPFKQLYISLKEVITPRAKFFETDNSQVYFLPVPKNLDDLEPLKKNAVIGQVNWTSTMTVTELGNILSSSLEEKVSQRLQNFKMEANRALEDITSCIGLVPHEESAALSRLLSEIYAKKSVINEMVSAISALLGQKSAIVSQRMPQAFNQFQSLRASIDQAAQTDLYFETQFGKGASVLTQLETKQRAIEAKRDQINQLLGQADKAAQVALESKSGSSQEILSQMQGMTQQFDAIAAQMNPVFVETVGMVKDLHDTAQRTVQQYRTEVATVKSGFENGLGFYTKLIASLNNLRDQLSRL